MRGTPKTRPASSARRRFIPAYAGNASPQYAAMKDNAVHPRVCGERSFAISFASHQAGSSPRMRGTHDFDNDEKALDRFIPAYAGNATQDEPASDEEPVHPRVCGERCVVCCSANANAGSSPRMRGTLYFAPAENGWMRFIPAYAGNAIRAFVWRGALAVHPRVCGERHDAHRSGVEPLGSSPRMRGTPIRHC